MIVDAVWEKAFYTIIKFVFVPYMLYFGLFVIYISFMYDMTSDDRTWAWIMLPYCVFYSILQLGFELKQMKDDGLDYFFSIGFIWNFLDIGSSTAVLTFSFMVFTWSD
jgi:hypothetical protein